jgi:uncharacterized protein YkwD
MNGTPHEILVGDICGKSMLKTIFALLIIEFIGEHALSSEPSAAITTAMLEAHNAVRKTVGTPPLEWSERLTEVAQKWANYLLKSGQFYHQPKNLYGENLYEISGGEASPVQVLNSWASEAYDYHHRTNSCESTCGHYTQIVWRETRQVGCAVAKGQGRQVWVCEYAPPGNFVGERPF